jgi:hypothetical protein
MRNPAVIALLSIGIALSGCTAGGMSTNGGMQQSQLTPLAVGAATPIPFTFQTVDDPASNVNKVNSINAVGEIVGTIGSGSPSSPFQSYTSSSPYQSFQSLSYAKAQGTVAMAVPTSTIIAGYVINPPQLNGIWAAANINGLWTIFKSRKQGSGKNAVTEILGVNASELAAGFYINIYGVKIPVEITIPTERFTALKPPASTGAEATGINGAGDISGWETTAAGTNGFLLHIGHYYTFSYPGAAWTQALEVNAADQVVGAYQDASGKQHGFILSNATQSQSQQVWQTIDEPNAGSATVVTGLNDSDDICGYYIDSSNVQHGFVAIP